MRRSIVVLLIGAALWAFSTPPLSAIGLPHPPKPSQLTVSGFVVGRVAKGNMIRFGIVASDPQGWANLESVQVLLVLHGQSLQEMTYFVKREEFKLGDHAPVSIESATPISTGFVQVSPLSVRMLRRSFSIRVTFWARVRDAIPNGTTFRVIARDVDGHVSRAREQVDLSGGFLTWGTFAIGVLLALLLGYFISSARFARRLRERQPSIWTVLERRLREERARPPALAGVSGDGGLG